MFKDAIDTAEQSKKKDLAQDLLNYFIEIKDKESFCATLFTCYDLVEPDVVLELGFRNDMMNFCLPYFVQYVKEMNAKVSSMDAALKPMEMPPMGMMPPWE